MAIDYKPTGLLVAFCTIIIAISFGFEHLLHYTGKYLKKKKNQKPLFDALQKVKEELMVLGFISLLLLIFEEKITKICVHKEVNLLPCDWPEELVDRSEKSICQEYNMFQLFSHEDLENLHQFIFLTIVHMILSVLTVVSGEARIRQWRRWEDSLANDDSEIPTITHIHSFSFHTTFKQAMGDYIAKSRNLVIILLISAAVCLAQASKIKPLTLLFKSFRVHIVNELSSEKEPVHVHCWSSEDDLGLHDLYPKGDLHWHFDMNVRLSTNFQCHIEWNHKKADFKVFTRRIATRLCGVRLSTNICWWAVKEDEFYFANYENPSPKDLMK